MSTLLSLAAPDDGSHTFASGPTQTSLLELYTSEGCSSCPPAEAWLSRLKDDSQLWREVVPVAFHVDYWDNLGWKDPFASRVFTARQYAYSVQWGAGSVYTPGFVLNGREWRYGGNNIALAENDKKAAGILTITIAKDRHSVAVSYTPPSGSTGTHEIHVALLGCGLRKEVGAGENSGRNLTHDFVVLNMVDHLLSPVAGSETLHATLSLSDLPPAARGPAVKLAAAAWVSASGTAKPEQAVGGWLP